MNRSGGPVKNALEFCRIEDPTKGLIVVHDDLENKFGKVKWKQGGSPQGHNGLKSIIGALNGCPDFLRMKIGVDRPESRLPVVVASYVTSNFEEGKSCERFSLTLRLEQIKKLATEVLEEVVALLKSEGFLP